MQPTGINALAAIVAAAPPQASGASANGADDNAPGQQFSQLLSDSGKQYDGQQTSQQQAAKTVQTSTAGALSAQEVTSTADKIAQLLAAQEQVVTPDAAKELLQHIDAMAAQSTGAADAQALSQIKQQLKDMVKTNTSKSIAEILAAAPAVKDAKLSLVGLTALLGNKKAPSEFSDTNDEDAQEVSPALATQVPVVVFRPDAGEAKAAALAAKSDPKKEGLKKDADLSVTDVGDTANAAGYGLITVMIPLVAEMTQPVAIAAPVAADISIKDTMPAPAFKPRSDIDQVVPPLTSNQGEEVLPVLNLPKAGSLADATTEKSAAANFQAMAAAAGAADSAKLDDKLGIKHQADLSALNNVAQTGNATPTQTAGAVQAASIIQTPGYTNHAQVSEQVSVAVTKASKDGIDHITIQLDPLGLGRVEVNMHTNRDGQTQISFTVDKADTFDSLSRDARSLERSLQEAGIKADTGSMQFNMRQQPQQMQSNLSNGQGQPSQQQAKAEDAGTVTTTTSVASIASATRNYLFNVREGVDISA